MSSSLERAYARSLSLLSQAETSFEQADQHFQTNPSVTTWIKRQTAQKKLFAARQRVLDTRKQWAKMIDKQYLQWFKGAKKNENI